MTIDAEQLREKLQAAYRESIDGINASYRDGSITSGEEFGAARYQAGLSRALKIIDELAATTGTGT